MEEDVISMEISKYFRGCCEILKQTTSPEGRMTAKDIDYLYGNLSCLWEMRKSREECYGRLIHQLQMVLTEVEPEEITLEQQKAMLEILQDASATSPLQEDNINTYLTKLHSAGYELFKELI